MKMVTMKPNIAIFYILEPHLFLFARGKLLYQKVSENVSHEFMKMKLLENEKIMI